MKNKDVCPFFVRRVSSHRFYGLKCGTGVGGMEYPTTFGDIGVRSGWTEEQRETKIHEHCHGEYTSCPMYKHAAPKRAVSEGG